MSTNTFPNFFDSQFLTTTNSEIYQVPASPSTQILQELQLKLTNTTAATRLVTLYALPAGTSTGDRYAIAKNMSVPPYDYIMVPVPRMDASDTLEGLCDVSSAVTIQAIGGKLHTP